MFQQAEILSNLTDLHNKINYYYRPQMESAFSEISFSEIESIELIALLDYPNVTKLAEALYVTRGAISKVTKKLLKKGLIESFKSPENKKEVYFRLTQAGTEINNRHEAMHKKFLKHDEVVFEELSEQESEIILNFLEKYNHHLDKALRTTFKK
jgi:DNA-binding MarR family transcriptional regulator